MIKAQTRIKTGALSLGFSTFFFQFLFLKESLTVYWGNELTIALVVAVWLVTTGIGTAIKRIKIDIGFILLAILPPISLVALRYLAPFMVLRGEVIGPNGVILITTVAIGPFCLVSGALFSSLLRCVDTVKLNPKVLYALEGLGAFIGGAFYTFFASHAFKGLELAFWVSFVLSLTQLFLSAKGRLRFMASLLTGTIALVALFARWLPLEEMTMQNLFHGVSIKKIYDTPYGKIVIASVRDERMVFFNNSLYYGESVLRDAEESVHFAMAQRFGSKAVLAIGGGPGVLNELGKYPDVKITYMDIDPLLLKMAKEGKALGGATVTYIEADPRAFFQLRSRHISFDTILLNTPDPRSSSINRLYTVEFFKAVKRKLEKGGVLSLGIYHYTNHLSKDGAYLIASVRNALLCVFENVIIIPGSRFYLIASDAPLTYDIASRLDAMGIGRYFVRDEYLRAYLSQDRLAYVTSVLKQITFVNTDVRPITYYYYVLDWLEGYKGAGWVMALFLASVVVLELISATSLSYAMFTTGIFSMGMGLLLLFMFQAQWGSLYRDIGLFTGIYMLGSAMGGWRASTQRPYGYFSVESAMLSLGLLIFLGIQSIMRPWAHGLVLFLLNALMGFLVVEGFGSLAREAPKVDASRFYRADLIGAAVGAMVIALFIVPSLGIENTALVLGLVKGSSLLLLLIGWVVAPSFGGHLDIKIGWSWIFLSTFSFIGGAIYLYDPGIFYDTRYYGLVFIIMMSFMVSTFFKKAAGRNALHSGSALLRYLNRALQLVLIPFLLFPFITCPYKLPFIFCKLCPRRCPWGDMRGFIFSGAILLNLGAFSFCTSKCPFGALQTRIFSNKAWAWAHWGNQNLTLIIRCSSLLVIFSLVLLSYGPLNWKHILNRAMLGHIIEWPLLLFLGVLLLSIIVLRPWCRFICPIGTMSKGIWRQWKE